MSFPQSSDIVFIKIIYYFYKIIGLMVVNVEIELDKEQVDSSFKFSVKGILYNVFVFFCLCIQNLVSLNDFKNLDFYVSLENFFQKFQTVFTLFTCFVILTTFCFQQKKFIEVANELKNIKNSLTIINPERSKHVSMLSTMKIVYFFIVCMWCVLIVTSYMGSRPLIYIFIHSANLIINWMIVQYSSVIILVYHLFESINLQFKKTFVCSISSRDDEISSIKLKEFLFFQYRRLYLSLCAVTNRISDYYSLPMLFCLMYIFITSLLYLFYCGELIFYNVSIRLGVSAYTNGFLWVVLYIFSLTVISKAATKTTAEVNTSS